MVELRWTLDLKDPEKYLGISNGSIKIAKNSQRKCCSTKWWDCDEILKNFSKVIIERDEVGWCVKWRT
jgi:hypothetical protein